MIIRPILFLKLLGNNFWRVFFVFKFFLHFGFNHPSLIPFFLLFQPMISFSLCEATFLIKSNQRSEYSYIGLSDFLVYFFTKNLQICYFTNQFF